MQYRLKSPLTAQMELTTACNALCEHCYNYWRYVEKGIRDNKDSRRRSLEHFQSTLQSLIDQQVQIVTFTGGEPFIRRDVLFDLIKQAKEADLTVSVNTNATMVREDDANRLRSLGVNQVLVSLHSAFPETHDRIVHAKLHAKTIRGIERLNETGIFVMVNMVVSQLNLSQIRETARLVRDLGVKNFSATPILACHMAKSHARLMLSPEQIRTVFFDLNWVKLELGLSIDVLEPVAHCLFSEKERQDYSYILDHRCCTAGVSDCAISADGDVRPCILSSEVSGNIQADGWEKCWKGLNRWSSPNMLPGICRDCVSADFCGGGCRIAALAKCGDVTAADPFVVAPLDSCSYLDRQRIPSPGFTVNDQLALSKDLRLRKESFGGALLIGKRLLFLKESGFAFVQSLVDRTPWSVMGLATEFHIEEEKVHLFVQKLVNMKFATISEGKEVI